MEGIAQGEDGGETVIWGALGILAGFVGMLLIRSLIEDFKKRILPSEEEQFWTNKCHQAFNDAQNAYAKKDEYSFRKFAEQHALYYRRYKMARDGHFERKSE